MAERRMFAKTIVLSDAFLDLPLSARCLYFTLGMLADDDGFVNSPKSIMRQCGASEDDLKVLIAKKFLIPFDSGIIVIKHWRMNNYLQKDRYTETKYIEEKRSLSIDKNGSYHKEDELMYTQDMYTQGVYTQDRLGKDSIDKDSKGKDSKGKEREDKVSTDKNNKGTEARTYFPEDELLNNSFLEYIKMRKKIKKPMSDYAIDLAIKSLRKLAGNDNDKAIKILEQSIEGSWTGLYPLKDAKTDTLPFS